MTARLLPPLMVVVLLAMVAVSVGALRAVAFVAPPAVRPPAYYAPASADGGSDATVDSHLDPGMVARAVRRRLPAIKACYEEGLKRKPSLAGRVVTHWIITATGDVTGVDAEVDDLGNRLVTACILAAVAKWKFPRPAGGSVEVSFPFVFQAAAARPPPTAKPNAPQR